LVEFVKLVLLVRTGEKYEFKYRKDARARHADFSGRVAGSNIAKMREHAMQIFQAGLQAVDPVEAIERHIRIEKDLLFIGDRQFDLKDFDRIVVVGAGKAVAPRARPAFKKNKGLRSQSSSP
jgi:hypothetical protein